MSRILRAKHLVLARPRNRRAGAPVQRTLAVEPLERRELLATSYVIEDLGTLPDTDTSVAVDINNLGEVVGYSSRTGLTPQTRAFKYDATGGIQDVGTLGGDNAGAVAINEVGQIAGWAHDANGKTRGFRYDPGGSMIDIGDLGWNAGVYPRGINNNGDVVGGSYVSGMGVGFLYTDSQPITVVTPMTNTASRTVVDINDAGIKAVYSSANSWVDGESWIDGAPTAVNNANQATGTTGKAGQVGELFRYTPGVGQVNLGQLDGDHTVGEDINESGDVVGYGRTQSGTSHALIFTDADGMVDLNHLISPDSGWVLTAANGINDQGAIVGTGLVGGQQHAFLLTPFSGTDDASPQASLAASDLTAGQAAPHTFTIVYWDRDGVSVASLDNSDVAVRAPDGTLLPATFEGVDVDSDGIRRIANYSITAPGGAWGARDNGTYTVLLNAGEVSDTTGGTAAEGQLGTFDVAIPHQVTASVTGPSTAQASAAVTFTLQAATTWSSDPNANFTFQIDWDGDATADETITGASGTQVDHTFAAGGSFSIRVTTNDGHGATGDPATHDILVTPPPGYQVWEFGPALPGTERAGGAGLSLGGTLYVLGGTPYDNNGEEGAVHFLDPSANRWEAGQHLDSGRLKDVGVGIDVQGQPIVYGGTLEDAATNLVFVFSSQDGKGDQLTPRQFEVTDFAFAADGDGLLYALGGDDAAGPTTFVERYDGAADAWTELTPMPQARSHAAAVYDDAGHILVVGGLDASGSLTSTVFSYDIAGDSWSSAADVPHAVRDGAAALGADGLVYMLGGVTAQGETAGVYVYNPASGSWQAGPEMQTPRSDFAVALSDNGYLYAMGGSATNTVERLDTDASGQSPVATNDNEQTGEDQPLAIAVLDNDSDPDGDPISVASVDTSMTTGTVAINSDNTVTYTPAADFVGTDSFHYAVSDSTGRTTIATVTVDVVSDGLTADRDSAATDEDTPLTVIAPGLLDNDSSTNAGASLSVTSWDAASTLGATVSVDADGGFHYDPTGIDRLQSLAAGATVDDSFTYTVADGTGASETALVTVTITGVNDDPQANDDTTVVGYKIEVVDFPGAAVTSITAINNQGLVLGTFNDDTGGHIFLYDGVTFTQVDDPVATPDLIGVVPHGLNDAGIIVGGKPGNDSNINGFRGNAGFVFDGTHYTEVQYGVRDSSLVGINNNDLAVGSYSSPADHGMTTAFGFTYQNGRVGSFTHPDHTYLRGTWLVDATDSGVLLGNYYPGFYSRARGFIYDGQTFTDILMPGTTWGSAEAMNNLGHVVGQQIRQNGADRFGFVYDGFQYESFQYPGWSGWTTLSDINDAGVLAGGAAGHGFIARPATSTDKNTVFVGRAGSTLGNDMDVDFNDELSALTETVTSTLGASVTIHADGRFEFDPTGSQTLQALAAGDSVSDTFTYTATDTNGGTDTATVSITVYGATDANGDPTANLNPGSVTAGAADYTFTVGYNDNSAIDVATIDSNDIRVTGANGFNALATKVGVNNDTNGPVRTATYRITAPGGAWDGADNGAYTVSIEADQVLDEDGNAVAAAPLGSFQVAIDAVPVLTVTGKAFANIGDAITLTLDATSSYPADPTDVFTFDIDFNDDGTYDQQLSGPTGTQASHTYTSTGSYSIAVRATDPHGRISVVVTHNVFVSGYGVWSAATALPVASTFSEAVAHNGSIYLIGGRPFDNSNDLNAPVFRLTAGADQWQKLPSLGGPLQDVGVGVDSQNRIVVFGGAEYDFDHGNVFQHPAFVYDPAQGEGDGLADVPLGNAADFAYATDDQGRMYVIGGGSNYPSGTWPNRRVVHRYDDGSDTWERLADLPAGRANASAVYDGQGHILVFGGIDEYSSSRRANTFSYDIADGTWTEIAPLPQPLSETAAVLGGDGLIYVIGGSPSNGSSVTSVHVFDPETRAWAQGPALPRSGGGLTATLSDDGYIYVLGGGSDAVHKLDTVSAQAPAIVSTPTEDAIVGYNYSAGGFVSGSPRPTYELLSGPAGLSLDPQTGLFSWTPTVGQDGLHQVAFRASNAHGSAEATFTINVLAEPPDVTAPTTPTNLQQSGATTSSITLSWDAATDDRGPITYKIYATSKINRWHTRTSVVADGITDTTHTMTGLSAGSSHKYSVSAIDAGGNESPRTAVVSMRAAVGFEAMNPVPDHSGVVAQFNRSFDTAGLNLFTTESAGLGPADVTLEGNATGPVAGSLVIGGGKLRFIATGGPLPADSYTFTLRSGADGFRDYATGEWLDGDGDGTPGGDFVHTFATTAPHNLIVSLPDFTRAPGQAIDIPRGNASQGTNTGLPIRLSNALGVETVELTLQYDPTLLTISDALAGPDAPLGATVSLVSTGAQEVTITFFSPAALPAGPAEIITLVSEVPTSAASGTAQVLDIASLTVNAGAMAATADAAVHVVGLFGDVTGNGDYSGLDAQRVARVVVGLDNGFADHPLIDPVLIGDVTGNGTLSALDSQRIAQRAVGMNPVEIPPLPGQGAGGNLLLDADQPLARQAFQPDMETVPSAALSQAELSPIVERAIGIWSTADLSPAQHDVLREIDVKIDDLPGAALGHVRGTTITVDVDAAGAGWFIDETPADNVEFVSRPGTHDLIAAPNSDAHLRADLLTAVLHEIGHLLGYDHDPQGIMQETLSLGTRRVLGDDPAGMPVDPEVVGEMLGRRHADVDAVDGVFASIG